jgi:hypothetical protein
VAGKSGTLLESIINTNVDHEFPSNTEKYRAIVKGMAYAETLSTAGRHPIKDYTEKDISDRLTLGDYKDQTHIGILQVGQPAVEHVYGIGSKAAVAAWADISDPSRALDANITAGVKYLHIIYNGMLNRGCRGDLALACSVAGYNWGYGHVWKIIDKYTKDNGAAPTSWGAISGRINKGVVEYVERANGYARQYYNVDILSSSVSGGYDIPRDISMQGVISRRINPQPIQSLSSSKVPDTAMDDVPAEDNSPDFFKIGDVVLQVPPQAISMQEANVVNTIDTVRTKGSPKIYTGQTQSSITIDMIFPGAEDINGYFDTDNKWHGGLRGLIAQFFRTPFVPIENDTVRNMVYPPGFTPYEKSSGQQESINDVKLYSENLRSVREEVASRKGDTELIDKMLKTAESTEKTIENIYREELAKRNSDPMYNELATKWEDILYDDSGGRYKDRQLAVVLDSFSISTMPGRPDSLRVTMSIIPFNFDPYSTIFGFLRTDSDAAWQADDYHLLSLNPAYNMTDYEPTLNVSASEPFKKYYRAILREWQEGKHMINGNPVYKLDTTLLDTYNSDSSLPIRFTYNYTKATRQSLLAAHAAVLKAKLNAYSVISQGLEAVKIETGEVHLRNNYIPTMPHEEISRYLSNWATMVGRIPHYWEAVEAKIKTGPYGLQDKYMIWSRRKLGYVDIDEFLKSMDLEISDSILVDALREVIDSEIISDTIPLAQSTVVLDGGTAADPSLSDRVVTGISSSYSNKVTPIKLVGHRDPTFQYMGGSDVSFTINIQTTSEALISELRSMSLYTAQTQMLAQMTGINSMLDYIDTSAIVDGEFFRMLGVQRVAVTDVTYTTVPEHPGLYEVVLQCIQADFDIKRYEAIVSKTVITEAMVVYTMNKLWKGPNSWTNTSVWNNYSEVAKNLFDSTGRSDIKNAIGEISSRSKIAIGKFGKQIAIVEPVAGVLAGAGVLAFGLASAEAGALIGTAIFPGVGTAIGAVVIGALGTTFAVIYTGVQVLRVNESLANSARVNGLGDLLDYIQLRNNIITGLSNDTYRTELSDKDILETYRKAQEISDKSRLMSTCYPDMYLPNPAEIGANTPVPPDFYFKREELAKIDDINTELGILNRMSKYKLMKMLEVNLLQAKGRIVAVGAIWDRLLDITSRADEAYTIDPATGVGRWNYQQLDASFQEVIDLLKPYSQADVNGVVATIAEDIAAAYTVKVAKEDITKILTILKNVSVGDKKGAADALFSAPGMEAFNQTPEIEGVTDKLGVTHGGVSRAGSRALAQEQLERMQRHYKHKMASILPPNGIIEPSTLDTISMANNTYGTMSLMGEANSIMVQAKALDSRRTCQSLQMARAFPTFKLYFIEEDASKWLLFDDFYGYSAVKSIDVVSSRKSASNTAVVRLSNITGRLTDPIGDYYQEDLTKEGTVAEQKLDRLMLRVGCPIMIRMGYSNDPNELEVVFYGAIAELKPGEGEIEIVAQSWGAQLNTPLPIKGNKGKGGESIGWWDLRNSHGDIVTWALGHVSMKHMGGRSIFEKTNDDIRITPASQILTPFLRQIIGYDMGNNNTRDDNVYLPYDLDWYPWSNPTFDWRIDQGTTIWELIQEILLWYPDWIATMLPYKTDTGNFTRDRATLYIGPKEGFYKYTDKYNEDWATYQQHVLSGKVLASETAEEKLASTPISTGAAEVDAILGGGSADDRTPRYSIMVGDMLKKLYVDLDIDKDMSAVNALVRKIGGNTAKVASPITNTVAMIFDPSHNGLHYNANNGVDTGKVRTTSTLLGKLSSGAVPINCAEFAKVAAAVIKCYGGTPLLATLATSEGTTHVIPIGFLHYGVVDKRGNVQGTYEDRAKAEAAVISLRRATNPGYEGKTKNQIDESWAVSDIFLMVYPTDSGAVAFTYYTKPDLIKVLKGMGYMYCDLRKFENLDQIIQGTPIGSPTTKSMDRVIQYPKGLPSNIGINDPSTREHFFDDNGNLLQCFAPVTRYHFYDSLHHIIDNSITTSVDSMANKVIMTFPKGEPIFSHEVGKFDDIYEMVADDDIDEDHIRAYYTQQKNIDTNWWANGFATYNIGHQDSTTGDVDGSAHVPVYIRVASTILNNQVMEMYDGTLTVVGDPSVRPWDTCYMYDFENSMYGPFQVEQVIHHFSEETGFVTTITPDLVTHVNRYTDSYNTDYMNSIIPSMFWNGLKGAFWGGAGTVGGAMTLGKAAPGMAKLLVGGTGWGKAAIGGVGKAAGSAIGTRVMGAIPVVGVALILGLGAKDLIGDMGLTVKKEVGRMLGRQPITISPLMYDGEPLVAGLEGMRTDTIHVHMKETIKDYGSMAKYYMGLMGR